MRETDFAYDFRGLPTSVSSPIAGTVALPRSNPRWGDRAAPSPRALRQDSAPGTATPLLVLAYDVYGNLTQVQQPGTGRCTGLGYDDVFHQLPTQTQKFRGGCGNAPLTTSRIYDRGLERVLTELSPSEGMATAQYDAFGRLTKLFAPSDTASAQSSSISAMTADYSLFDGHGPVRKVQVTAEAGVGGPKASVLYFDAYGRKLVTLEESETPLQWVVHGASAVGASTGRVLRAWAPFFVPVTGADGSTYDVTTTPSGPSEAFTYDAFGSDPRVPHRRARAHVDGRVCAPHALGSLQRPRPAARRPVSPEASERRDLMNAAYWAGPPGKR